MAHDPRALQRLSSVIMPSGAKVHKFFYATNHTKAETITDGFFNSSRDSLSVGSIIEAVVDHDGTANLVNIRVTAAPATGNVTVVVDVPDDPA